MDQKAIQESFWSIWQLSNLNFNKESSGTDHNFLSKVSKTGWLSHVENLINSAIKASRILEKGTANILVYC